MANVGSVFAAGSRWCIPNKMHRWRRSNRHLPAVKT